MNQYSTKQEDFVTYFGYPYNNYYYGIAYLDYFVCALASDDENKATCYIY